MHILGLSFNYHDAAAAIIRNGQVIAAAEEERFSRRKHDPSFPAQAIAFCLHQAGLSAADLDGVAFYEKPVRKLERVLLTAQATPGGQTRVAAQLHQALDEGLRLEALLAERIGYTGPVAYSDHHLSHAASAFYLSPFDQAAVLTIDGVGEWATAVQFAGDGARLHRLREIRYPDSIGLFYSALTAFLGFRVNDDEYKIMGLASYGKPRFAAEFDQLIQVFDDGSFALAPEFFAYTSDPACMYTQRLVDLLGPARLENEPITARHQDIAASLQSITEQAVAGLARSMRDVAPSRNLCLAGGVAYNCAANAKLLGSGMFDHIFIQPAAGDSGGAIGAALVAYYDRHSARTPAPHYDTCLGPAYDDGTILAALEAAGLEYEVMDTDALCAATARLIARDAVVGWFQGRMEFGPRALGSRSILANPANPQMQDILNSRVKFREEFRPFAPAVLEERASEFFEMTAPSPHMLFTPRVRPEHAPRLPSITHVDGTARVQTVSRTQNPRFHRLIEQVAALTGIPIVINTSFNVRGEPIVCTPTDAVNCFLNTDIDALAIGNALVRK